MRWAYLAAGAVVALSLVQLWGERFSLRARRRLATMAGTGLALYGGVLVIAGALVLARAIDPEGDVDEYALRWHVFLWDLWFVVWDVALVAAARVSRARGSDPV